MSHCQTETSWYSQTRETRECCVVEWIQWEQLSILTSECLQTKVQSKEPFVCYVHKEWNVCMIVCCEAASWLSQCLPTGTGTVSVSAHRDRDCLSVCPQGQGLSQCLPTGTGVVSVSAHRDRDCLSVCPHGQGLSQCLPMGTGVVSVSAHRDRGCLSVCPQDRDCLSVCPQGQGLSQCLPTWTWIVSVSAHRTGIVSVSAPRVRNGTVKDGTMATLNYHLFAVQWGYYLEK